MSEFKTTYTWTVYLHYTDSEGYPWSEEFDVLGDTYEEAHATATRVKNNAYEPGCELELIKGPRVPLNSIAARYAMR